MICPINDGIEHVIISRHISSKSMEVSEVASILPQMENVLHDIRGIAIQKLYTSVSNLSMHYWRIVFAFNVSSISPNVD